MLILIVAGGPDKGRIFEMVEGKDVILGRDGDPIQLNDRKCSRRHARLWSDDGQWYLEDLGSKHGTYRNHHKIPDTQAIRDGDYLQVGQTVLVLARMPQSLAERNALLTAGEQPTQALAPKAMKLLVGGGAIAAAAMIGLNVMTYLKASSGTQEISSKLAEVAKEADRSDFETEVRTMLTRGNTSAEQMSEMIAALGPEQTLFRQELADQLKTVMTAVEDDTDSEMLVGKFDQVLTAMEAQGGETAKLAGRVLEALAEQPTAEQLADATARRVAETVQPLSPEVVESLTEATERLAASESINKQVKDLRRMVEQMPGKITPSLETVIARLNTFDTEGDRDALLAAIDALRKQIPADPSGKLDAALARLEATPTRDELAFVADRLKKTPTRDEIAALAQRVAALPTLADLEAVEQRSATHFASVTAMLNEQKDGETGEELDGVREQLATIVAELKDRPDASLIQKQLEALAADRPTEPDPLLAQVLAAVQERNVNDQKVAELLAKLEDQPYNNDAMLEEIRGALADLPEPPPAVDTDALLSSLTDTLAEKSVTDADQLRALIRIEVASALKQADVSGQTAMAAAKNAKPLYEPSADDGLTRTEQAYKLAYETGKQISLDGRVLDPAAAKAAGIATWRDWYLMDDFAERMRLARQASRVRGTVGDPSVVTLPDHSGTYAAPRGE